MAKPQYQRKMKSLTDQVYDKVRTDIISQQLLPGDRIVELDIAETMGTSQAPVREALQRLEREGLVNRQARSATYVTKTSIDEIFELFSIRSQIEGYAIKRTVRHITPIQIMELEALVEQMKAAGELDNMVMLTEYDMLFHRNICQWSGSVALLRSWDPLFSQIQRFVVNTHKDYFDELTDIADTHLPIIAALRAGDEDEAARVMQEHVMFIWTRIEQKK